MDSDTWYPGITVKASDGTNDYLISDTIDGTYSETYTYSTNGNNDITLYFKTNDDYGYITDGKTDTVKIDKTAPDFDAVGNGIKITPADKIWNMISPSLLFSKFQTQNVNIMANDTESGIDSCYYYVDYAPEKILSSGELDGKTFKKGSIFKVDQTGKCVIYAYAVDKVGNKSDYISSEGIIIDNDAPVITATVPDEGKEDVKANLHLTSSETGTTEYLITTTQNEAMDYDTLHGNAEHKTESIVDAQVTKGADIALTGLTGNTIYYVYAVVKDEAGNVSNVASCSFKTKQTDTVMNSTPSKISDDNQGVDTTKNQSSTTTKDGKPVKTGDNNNIWLYVWSMVIGGVVIVVGYGMMIVKKKKAEIEK